MAPFHDEFKQVLRRLARAPLFTAITLITLAVGIGANTVVFSVIEGVLLKPLRYAHPEQLVGVWVKAPGVNVPRLNMAAYLYFVSREQNTTFQDIGLYNGDSVSITGAGQPEHVRALDVTDGTLPLLGVKPVLGRIFTQHDDLPGAPKTIVLSYRYWQQRFGGSDSVVGRPITVDGTAHEIIGILPTDFQFLDERDADLFLPLQLDRSKVKLGNFSYVAMGRLKPGVTVNQAGADLERLAPIALRTFPPPEGFSVALFEKAQITPSVWPLKKDLIGDIGNVLWVLMGSIVVVLLVACANVANLLLVRVEGRRQELAIRSALGAGRRNITIGLLLESLVLGLAGSLIGLALAFGALRILVAIAPTGLPRLHEIEINVPVLLFTLGVALFVSLVIGMIPVFKYAGVSASTGLREGGRALSQSRERHRARKILVVVQVALALVLLICSGLMIRTFRALVQVSPGYADPDTLASFSVYIPEAQIPATQGERVIRMEQAIADKLASVPGVRSVSISTSVPMDGNETFNPLYAADRAYKEGELAPLRRFNFIAPGYFSTMGIPMVAGRDLTWTETYEKRPVTIISDNFAREYWGSPAAALGKRIREAPVEDWHEIVGVVGNVYDEGVSQPAPPEAYWPLFADRFNGDKEMVRRDVNLVIRTPRAGSAAFVNEMQRTVWSINPDLALANPTTAGRLYTKSMARTSFALIMLCVAGSMALLLGIVGIYGVISYTVTQRTREIGIRMALGAQRQSLTAMFVGQGLLLAGIGAGSGLVVALLSMRLMSSILFHVSPMDPWTYALATLSVIAIAWLACYLPSRRAALVNPVDTLRAE